MTTNTTSWIINNVQIVQEEAVTKGAVIVADGKIEHILSESEYASFANEKDLPVLDGNGGLLMPGFIDIHVHGGNGGDFMNANRESFDAITSFHAAHGTTAMLATTMTASKEAIEAVLSAVTEYRSTEMPYTELIGVHLEGPFISEKWPGAQNPSFIHPPSVEWVKEWNSNWPDQIKQLTMAPEKPGAIETIKWLSEQGIIVACGHTDAVYAELKAAADAGLAHAVHTYNAMRGLHHREPGTLGAVLTDDRIYCEIIADGEHVHPAAINLMLRAKPLDKVIIITDAIEAAGMPDGNYQLGGLAVTVSNGTARLTEGNALAGSSLTMNRAIRYLAKNTSLHLNQISRMASGNPARELRIFDQTGSIETGKRADLVWLDNEYNVQQTWVQGRTIFTK